jgi:elongation factor P
MAASEAVSTVSDQEVGENVISARHLRVGMLIKYRDDLCRVLNVLHITPGNWRGLVQTKLRSLTTGNSLDHRFRSDDQIERAVLEQHRMQCLYQEGDNYVFMNIENYEQVTLDKETLGDAVLYLLPNTELTVEVYEGSPVGVELPITVELKVVETEPPMKGATASGGGKPAKLETGLTVEVPQFVEAGEVIRVDTREGKYVERAK